MRCSYVVLALAGCGGGHGGDLGTEEKPPCTAAAQEVPGTMLAYTRVVVEGQPPREPRLLVSAADVAAAFEATPPPEVAGVDFANDRVVLGASNPDIAFAVEDGATIVVGENPLCQGIPPVRVAYIVRGTTRDALVAHACPYTGPEPCLAP